MRFDQHPLANDDLAPRRGARWERDVVEPVDSEFAGVDRALARTLAPTGSRSRDATDDAGRSARIFEASRRLLPSSRVPEFASHVSGRIGEGRLSAPGRGPWVISRARIAIAAAAMIALALGSVEAMRQALRDLPGSAADGREIVAKSEPLADSIPHPAADPATPGAAEATLIALLAPGGREFEGERGWMDERAFTGTAAARSVAPVLEIRGADIDDFAAELGSILGVVSLRPL